MARQSPYDRSFQVALMGMAAGLVGTLAMTTALQVADRLLRRRDAETSKSAPSGEEPVELSADASGPAPAPTEQVAERLANRVFQRRLSTTTRQRLGIGVYWAYGAFWGALSAHLQLSLRPPTAVYGTILGLVVWLVGPMRLVPALGLYVRPASTGRTARLVSVVLHVVYGLTTAFTLARLSGGR